MAPVHSRLKSESQTGSEFEVRGELGASLGWKKCKVIGWESGSGESLGSWRGTWGKWVKHAVQNQPGWGLGQARGEVTSAPH